jgi:hypothetical protein
LEVVKRAVQTELSTAAIDALREAASTDIARYRGLLAILDPDVITAPLGRWTFPILAPIAGRRTVTGRDVADLYARRAGPLVDALAASGVPVLDANGLDDSEVDSLLGLVSRLTGRRHCRDAYAVYTLVEPVEPTGLDDALLASAAEILAKAVRAPSSIHFARLTGHAPDRFCIGADTKRKPWLVEREAIDADPLRLLARPALVLNVRHPLVAAARAAMEVEPEVAATFVARGVLLSTNRLDAAQDEALTRAAIERMLGGDR